VRDGYEFAYQQFRIDERLRMLEAWEQNSHVFSRDELGIRADSMLVEIPQESILRDEVHEEIESLRAAKELYELLSDKLAKASYRREIQVLRAEHEQLNLVPESELSNSDVRSKLALEAHIRRLYAQLNGPE
jgi:hypothetical protein